MASYAPGTNLWLERSRLDGMLLSAVSYGIFFLLTIQAMIALTRKPRHGDQVARHRGMLLGYIWITFVLATIGFASNARYTEMIWIDLRDIPGGPTVLILDELNYWINVMATACYYVMEWFMQALLLYRCFTFWDWQKCVIVPLSTLFVAMMAMSILVLAESGGTIFYNINTQLAYLCLQVGLTIIYTVLVAGRLFFIREQLRDTVGGEYLNPYKTAAIMVVESAALYSVLGIIFIFSFAFHSSISNLVFTSVSHVQGIAQLLIIIRVAKGGTIQDVTLAQAAHTSIAFNTRGSDPADPESLDNVDDAWGVGSVRSRTDEKP